MHVDIAAFINFKFYGGSIRTCTPEVAPMFGGCPHFCFVDVGVDAGVASELVPGSVTGPSHGGRIAGESRVGHSTSFQNIHEAECVVQLLEQLHETRDLTPPDGSKATVAIIAPYRAQVALIKELLGRAWDGIVVVGTSDSFEVRQDSCTEFKKAVPCVLCELGGRGVGLPDSMGSTPLWS